MQLKGAHGTWQCPEAVGLLWLLLHSLPSSAAANVGWWLLALPRAGLCLLSGIKARAAPVFFSLLQLAWFVFLFMLMGFAHPSQQCDHSSKPGKALSMECPS